MAKNPKKSPKKFTPEVTPNPNRVRLATRFLGMPVVILESVDDGRITGTVATHRIDSVTPGQQGLLALTHGIRDHLPELAADLDLDTVSDPVALLAERFVGTVGDHLDLYDLTPTAT